MPLEPPGAFISHIAEESPVALVLQKYLRAAFGDDFPIFVSTDKKSIPTGQQWYESIVQNLKRSQVVIILLSAESARRGWITFEAGVGIGEDALVIPVTLSRFTFSQLAYPLAGIQGRMIDEIGLLVDAIAEKIGRARNVIDVDGFLREIAEAEAKLNYKSLLVEPLLDGQNLCFDITNIGNVDLEILMLEVLVPNVAVSQRSIDWAHIDQLGTARDGKPYSWFACYSPRGAHGDVKPILRPIITPSMQKVRQRFSIPIGGPLSPSDLELYVCFQIHAVGYQTQMECRTLKELQNPLR